MCFTVRLKSYPFKTELLPKAVRPFHGWLGGWAAVLLCFQCTSLALGGEDKGNDRAGFCGSHPSQVRDGWGTRHLWLGMGGQRQGQRQMQRQERGWLLRFPTLGTRTRMCRGWGTRTSLVLAGKRARLVPGSWVLLGPSGLCSRRFPRGCRLPLLRRRRRRSGWPGRCIR